MIKGIDYIGIAVAATIYHPQKGILFGMRTHQCRDEPDVRDNRGGGLKFNETIKDGIKRELKEEAGRDFNNEQIYSLGHREQFRIHEGKTTHWLCFYHLVVMNGDEVITNNEPDKRGEIRYFPLDQLPPQATVHSMVYLALEEFKEQIEEITGKIIPLTKHG